MREQLRMPPRGFDPRQKFEYAYKHTFFRFLLHPRLQEGIFSSDRLKEGEVYQDMPRLPSALEDALKSLDEDYGNSIVSAYVAKQMAAIQAAARVAG